MKYTAGLAADPPGDAALVARAQELADELGIPIDPDADVLLVVRPQRLECRVQRGDEALAQAKPTWIDLTTIDTTSGPGRSLQNPLLKAVGIRKGDLHRPRVLDGTAGFGEDAWLLASAGCAVTACERHPLLFALLRDAHRRASEAQPDIATRLQTVHADSQAVLRLPPTAAEPRVIYLDPMFNAPRKTAPRKALRLAGLLLADTPDDSPALLDAAWQSDAQRIVIKRPRKAPPVPGPTPIQSHAGKALRFDVYKPQTPRVVP